MLDLFYDARYAHTRMVNPDFIKLANSMNVHAIRVTSEEELPAKMKEFLEYDNSKPVLMECFVETNEHVFPMVSVLRRTRISVTQLTMYVQVPAGKALHEQILHPTFREAYAAANKK